MTDNELLDAAEHKARCYFEADSVQFVLKVRSRSKNEQGYVLSDRERFILDRIREGDFITRRFDGETKTWVKRYPI